MPIEAACSGCGMRLRAPERLAGKTAQCPKCKQPIMIPGAPVVAATAPAAVAPPLAPPPFQAIQAPPAIAAEAAVDSTPERSPEPSSPGGETAPWRWFFGVLGAVLLYVVLGLYQIYGTDGFHYFLVFILDLWRPSVWAGGGFRVPELVAAAALLGTLILRARSPLWGKLAIAGCLILLTMRLIEVAGQGAPMGREFRNFVWPMANFGTLLVFMAMASVPLGARTSPEEEPLSEATDRPFSLHPVLLAVLLPFTMNLLWLFWLYRAARFLKPLCPRRIPFSPGLYIMLLLVPFVGVYFLFRVLVAVFWSIRDLKRRVPDDTASAFAPGFMLTLFILALVLNILLPFAVALQLNPSDLAPGWHHVYKVSWQYPLLGELTFLTVIAVTQGHLLALARALAPAEQK